MRRLWAIPAGLLLLIAGSFLLPQEGVDRRINFDPAVLADNPEIWLQVSEQQYSDIRPGAAKRILWAGEKGRKTPLAIVYVHGFTGSAEELRPVPDEVARSLGANLYFTRLAGQGRSPGAMTSATAGDWVEDMAEAMAIGRMIGERVIVIGTSMGGALTALAASDPDLSESMAGVVLVSPAFGVRGWMGGVIDLPLIGWWGPLVFGSTLQIPAQNNDHARYFATEAPTRAVLPLAALIREARAQDYAAVKLPLLVVYSPDDKIVSPDAIAAVTSVWGGPVRIEERRMQAGDDPYAHVVAGDIFSPGQTEAVTAIILDWARGL